jgi:hypothetical protein
MDSQHAPIRRDVQERHASSRPAGVRRRWFWRRSGSIPVPADHHRQVRRRGRTLGQIRASSILVRRNRVNGRARNGLSGTPGSRFRTSASVRSAGRFMVGDSVEATDRIPRCMPDVVAFDGKCNENASPGEPAERARARISDGVLRFHADCARLFQRQRTRSTTKAHGRSREDCHEGQPADHCLRRRRSGH